VLAAVVEPQMGRYRGRSVKWLGDGVMSYFRDPADAVMASLELVEALPKAGLPPAHAGVAAGPVVVQAGDYFGRTVNAAARISAVAVGGQVLVDEVVTETPPEGVRFQDVGLVELKGLTPKRLFEACRVRRNS
jgi:adenylate cyclase